MSKELCNRCKLPLSSKDKEGCLGEIKPTHRVIKCINLLKEKVTELETKLTNMEDGWYDMKEIQEQVYADLAVDEEGNEL